MTWTCLSGNRRDTREFNWALLAVERACCHNGLRNSAFKTGAISSLCPFTLCWPVFRAACSGDEPLLIGPAIAGPQVQLSPVRFVEPGIVQALARYGVDQRAVDGQ